MEQKPLASGANACYTNVGFTEIFAGTFGQLVSLSLERLLRFDLASRRFDKIEVGNGCLWTASRLHGVYSFKEMTESV